MMRSLYSGVSGLINHQTRMDVIGNNISNVNTIGYKKDRVVFQDIISQVMSGSSKPTNEKGGVNPKQVGLGMSVAAIDKIMTQGAIQTTGKNTDLAVMGEGFFIEKKGDQSFYSRAGNFGVDVNKTLVNPSNGFKIQGWSAQTLPDGTNVLNTAEQPGDIIIPVGDKMAAQATSFIKFKSNLNSASSMAIDPFNPTEQERAKGLVHTTSIKAYDSKGNTHDVVLEFNKVSENRWRVVTKVPDSIEGSTRVDVTNPTLDGDNTFFINFDNRGALVSVEDGTGTNRDILAQGDLSVNLNFNVNDGTVDAQGNPIGQQQTLRLDLGTVGQYNGITQFGSDTTTKAVEQNGYGMGYLESFQINDTGTVIGTYSNGTRKELAQVALATFVNSQGLEKAGDTNFVETVNSGIANVGAAGVAGKGIIVAGALEMANVDLSQEFTDMIVTQRGFQANSRTITTTDTMLEEILRLKR
ncbi:MAG TPA: flagellar hook protein FlgE [Spirochaetia bacterium]|nr:MAG: flagellar hook protein FlgE [Spirochaetes bacterium GWB1_36_13]HCL56468.1 flagellar hook protein FlgE [Spirochaetia bacterium]